MIIYSVEWLLSESNEIVGYRRKINGNDTVFAVDLKTSPADRPIVGMLVASPEWIINASGQLIGYRTKANGTDLNFDASVALAVTGGTPGGRVVTDVQWISLPTGEIVGYRVTNANGSVTDRRVYFGASLNLNFVSGAALDSRITFTRASTGTYVNSAGVLSSAAIDAPRFDYDPVTLAAKGLLIEEQRTNQQLYSEDISQWATPADATVTLNAAVAPDGNTTADKLIENTLTAAHFLSASSINHSYVSGTLYTRSCFLKAAGRFIVSVYLPGSAFPSNNRQALFNLNAGTVYSVEPNVTASIQPFGNGWYRCSITATANVTGVGHVGGSALIDDSGNGTYLGDGVSGAFIWGGQMEVASFATSYIPTTTTALTRAADIAAITGTNFSSWYNGIEGTIYTESSTLSASAAGVLTYAISDNTFNQSIYGNFSSGNTCRGANVLDGGVGQANLIASFTGLTTTNSTKDALAYKANDFAESCNGLAARTDNAGTVPAVNRLYVGSSWSGNSNFLNGHIQSFTYYPTRLSNAVLQALTA